MATVVPSDSINTFPSSMRTADVYSRFTTERNLVNMVNGVVDCDGYVKSYDNDGSGGPIEFVLGGYFFQTTRDAILTALGDGVIAAYESGTTITAYALVGYSSTLGDGATMSDSRLAGWNGSIQASVDVGGSFIGVNFVADGTLPTEQSGFTLYSLPILEYNGASWQVPETSFRKFDTLTNTDIDSIWENAEAENEQG